MTSLSKRALHQREQTSRCGRGIVLELRGDECLTDRQVFGITCGDLRRLRFEATCLERRLCCIEL
jgi:hypothetical protein